MQNEARQGALVGGYGSGKTHTLCAKGLELAAQNPGLPGMLVSPTYRMGIDILIPSFKAMLDEYGISYHYRASDYKCILQNGSEVWFRSADRPDKLKGATLAWAILDEAELMKKEVWTVSLSRVRHPKAKHHFVGAVSTSGDFGWLYDTFVVNHSNDPQYYIQHGVSSRENKSLPIDYVDTLLDNMTTEEVRAYIDGDFYVSKEGRVFPSFQRDFHLVDCAYNKASVACIGMDFNVHPATAVACQPYTYKGKKGLAATRFWTLPNSSTDEMAYTLSKEFGTDIPVYYDHTGNNRNHATGDSDRDILRLAGFKSLFSKQVKRVKDKFNHLGRALKSAKGETLMWVGKQCVDRANKQFPSLVECLENARWNDNRTDYDDPQYSHLLDCWAYVAYNVYPIRERPQFSGGVRATGF